MRNILYLLMTAVLLIACAPKIIESTTTAEPSETASEPALPAIMSDEVAKGETIYADKCARCHGAKIVDEISKERWDEILPKMIEMAELNTKESEKVTAYIKWEQNN